MEHNARPTKMNRFLKLFLIAFALFLAMYICALAGYSFVRNSAPQEHAGDAQNSTEYSNPEVSKAPFNLPYHTVEENASNPDADAQNETTETALSGDFSFSLPDKNDYLVISEEGRVNLYLITENGVHVFSKTLNISLDSLMPEDRNRLEAGIILASQGDLAALLEDYTS